MPVGFVVCFYILGLKTLHSYLIFPPCIQWTKSNIIVVMFDSPMSKWHLTTVCQMKKKKKKGVGKQKKSLKREAHTLKEVGWFTRRVSLISVTKTDFFHSHQQFDSF